MARASNSFEGEMLANLSEKQAKDLAANSEYDAGSAKTLADYNLCEAEKAAARDVCYEGCPQG